MVLFALVQIYTGGPDSLFPHFTYFHEKVIFPLPIAVLMNSLDDTVRSALYPSHMEKLNCRIGLCGNAMGSYCQPSPGPKFKTPLLLEDVFHVSGW